MDLKKIRIIGIDPGLQHTGWGIIDLCQNKISWAAHGIINPDTKMELAARLGFLATELSSIIDIYKPDEAAIEETFFANSAKTSLLLGHARGAAMAILAQNFLPVSEYATRQIKKAVVGTGTADKEQISFMVKRLLPNATNLKSDSADALAAAICHSSMRKIANLKKWG